MKQVKFCTCGRIHNFDVSAYDWLSEDPDKRRLLHICTHCGVTSLINLDQYEEGYAVNNISLIDGEMDLSGEDVRIIYSRGDSVFMKSGSEASVFESGYFTNLYDWSVNGSDLSIQDAYLQDIPWAVVDTDRLIRDIKRLHKDDADEILSTISGYYSNIHWGGTPYETQYNK